jgi:hypothetical protein
MDLLAAPADAAAPMDLPAAPAVVIPMDPYAASGAGAAAAAPMQPPKLVWDLFVKQHRIAWPADVFYLCSLQDGLLHTSVKFGFLVVREQSPIPGALMPQSEVVVEAREEMSKVFFHRVGIQGDYVSEVKCCALAVNVCGWKNGSCYLCTWQALLDALCACALNFLYWLFACVLCCCNSTCPGTCLVRPTWRRRYP